MDPKNTAQPKPDRRRNRLPDTRLAELLDIAASVFIQDGYQAASLNEIARRANASKPTLYARFPSKEALFLAVIDRRMQSIAERVTQFSSASPVAEGLRTFAYGLLRFALSPDQISLVRMISMEAERYPELARRYYERGPKRGEQALSAYCKEQITLGRLRAANTLSMARQFINLIAGSPVRWFVLGFDSEPLTEQALETHVDDAIQLWLSAYGAQTQDAPPSGTPNR
jgi:TetR/AcrR family transcriptional regulator, mexJK operon transcriptional repressor